MRITFRRLILRKKLNETQNDNDLLRVHGEVHNPLSGHVSGQLLDIGGQKAIPTLVGEVGIVAVGCLQGPSSVRAGLNGPHSVGVGGLKIALPLAVGESIQVTTQMTSEL